MCGGAGHIAQDCKERRPGETLRQFESGQVPMPTPADKAKMDSEYMSLMAELGETAPPPPGTQQLNGPPPTVVSIAKLIKSLKSYKQLEISRDKHGIEEGRWRYLPLLLLLETGLQLTMGPQVFPIHGNSNSLHHHQGRQNLLLHLHHRHPAQADRHQQAIFLPGNLLLPQFLLLIAHHGSKVHGKLRLLLKATTHHQWECLHHLLPLPIKNLRRLACIILMSTINLRMF